MSQQPLYRPSRSDLPLGLHPTRVCQRIAWDVAATQTREVLWETPDGYVDLVQNVAVQWFAGSGQLLDYLAFSVQDVGSTDYRYIWGWDTASQTEGARGFAANPLAVMFGGEDLQCVVNFDAGTNNNKAYICAWGIRVPKANWQRCLNLLP